METPGNETAGTGHGEQPGRVLETYDQLQQVYEYSWSAAGHECIHLGYYETGAEDEDEAAVATIEQLASLAEVSSETRILDIGCGAGEDLAWNASHRAAVGVGVDINEGLLERARDNADERDVAERVRFQTGDFHDLSAFEDGSFDVVWGLESIGHTDAFSEVFAAATRVLASGGRIALGGLFLTESETTEKQETRLERIRDTLAVSPHRLTAVVESLREAGCSDVRTVDATTAVKRGTKGVYRQGLLTYPLVRLLNVFGVTSDAVTDFTKTSIDLHKLLGDGPLEYRFVVATVN